MLYDGQPVELTADQEEVANMFAIMKETDYMNKQIFLDNFWNDFKKVLPCLPCQARQHLYLPAALMALSALWFKTLRCTFEQSCTVCCPECSIVKACAPVVRQISLILSRYGVQPINHGHAYMEQLIDAGNLQVLGKDHVIKSLKKCDFTPMYEHAMAEREKKKQMTREVMHNLCCYAPFIVYISMTA